MPEIKDKVVTVESLRSVHNSLSNRISEVNADLEDTTRGAESAMQAAEGAQSTASNALIAAQIAQATADGKVAKVSIEVELTAAGWVENVQVVDAPGITENNTIIVGPSPASHILYSEALIYCTAQEEGKLEFSCEYTPSETIRVNVVAFDGNASGNQDVSDNARYGTTLIDHITGQKYILYIQNGKLTMAESEV